MNPTQEAAAGKPPLTKLGRAAGLIAWALFAGLTVAVLVIVMGSIWIAVVGYSPTPFWDEWTNTTAEQVIQNLFAPHNEHRIVVTRLLIMVDTWSTQHLGILKLVWIFLFSLGHLLVLLALFRKVFPSGRSGPYLLLGLVGAAFFFSGAQHQNFTWGFQTQFVGVFFFASAACALVARAASRVGWQRARLATLAGLCGLLSTGSMINGLLVWPILALLAHLVRLGWRWTLGYTVAGTLTWLLYLTGLNHHLHPGQSVGSQSLTQLLSNPTAAVTYFLSYLGGALPQSLLVLSPFSQLDQLTTVAAAGLAVILLTVAGALRYLKSPPSPAILALLGAATFVALSAAMTAMGRIDLGATQSLTSRYSAGAGAFWTIALGLLLLPTAPKILQRMGTGVAALSIVALVLAQPVWIDRAGQFGEHKAEGQAALISGVFVPEVMNTMAPVPTLAFEVAQTLRARQQALFAAPYTRLVGQTLQPPQVNCENTGRSEPVYLPGLPKGIWRITIGGAVSGASALALVSPSNQVAALLIRGLKDDPASRQPASSALPVWAGYLPDREPQARYRVVAVNHQSQPLCQWSDLLEVDVSRRVVCPARLDELRIATGDAGWLDHIRRYGSRGGRLQGWAADMVGGKPTPLVVAVMGQQVVACGAPNIDRPDVAAAVLPSLERSGYSLYVAGAPGDDLKVYALQSDGTYVALRSTYD